MDARFYRAALAATALTLLGANYRTQNFVVEAPTPELAKEIGDTAEAFRRDLAKEWLGREMPRWAAPCVLTAQVSPELGAGGATSFVFDHGEVFGWQMNIQGSRQRILDSVLPHEVTHTIFASHFRRALPRWADEGACTTVEHPDEKAKQERMLITFLRTNRGISFSKMFAMKDYPPDVLPLYAQGYSLARFLIAKGGKARYLEFVGRGMQDENWPGALEQYYGIKDLLAMQNTWLEWVKQGSPMVSPDQNPIRLAAVRAGSGPIVRGQSEDAPTSAASPAHVAPARPLASVAPAANGPSGSAYSDAIEAAQRTAGRVTDSEPVLRR